MIASLDTIYLGNSVLSWLRATGLFVVSVVALSVARSLVLRYVQPSTTLRALALDAVAHTRYLFLAVIGLAVAATTLSLPAQGPNFLRRSSAVVVLLQMAWWGHAIVGVSVKRTTRRRQSNDVGSVTTIRALGIAARMILWLVCGLAVMATFGINVTALIAGLGIGGVAVALAVQSIMGDLFASVSIIIDKPFLAGDFIKVGELLGTVEEIGVKTTRIRSLSGQKLIFGNSDLLASRIQNFRRMSERRDTFLVGVEYGVSPEALERIPTIVREVIAASDDTRLNRVHFKEYGESSLTFEAAYYVLQPDFNRYMDVQQEVNLAIYRRFADAGIEFAVPTRTVMLRVAPEQLSALASVSMPRGKSRTESDGSPSDLAAA
ncbi:MAG: mechanosensitive ion channel family protein [Gemmatimonadaceae bacterium]|nr:mechanosensitive ion channel family protein [Gemmatimonadaceae bacterium]